MASYRSIKDFDWGLLLIALLISAIGILQIFSAGQGTKWKDLWWKQIIFVHGDVRITRELAVLGAANKAQLLPEEQQLLTTATRKLLQHDTQSVIKTAKADS